MFNATQKARLARIGAKPYTSQHWQFTLAQAYHTNSYSGGWCCLTLNITAHRYQGHAYQGYVAVPHSLAHQPTVAHCHTM